MMSCANEDADIDVVKTLLMMNNSDTKMISLGVKPRTMTWRAIYLIAEICVKTGLNGSTLMHSLAERRGRTALHYAARRGDLSIVELLLSNGADPNAKDARGKSVKDVCSSFVEMRGMLQKRQRKLKFRGTINRRTMNVEHLGRRLSTATSIQHDMYLISLDNLLSLYVNFASSQSNHSRKSLGTHSKT